MSRFIFKYITMKHNVLMLMLSRARFEAAYCVRLCYIAVAVDRVTPSEIQSLLADANFSLANHMAVCSSKHVGMQTCSRPPTEVQTEHLGKKGDFYDFKYDIVICDRCALCISETAVIFLHNHLLGLQRIPSEAILWMKMTC